MSRIGRPHLMVITFLVSFTVLGLEVALTRIYSYLLWYHYVFAAISISVMGIGLGSWLVYRGNKSREIIPRSLVGLAVSAILTLPGIFVLSITPFWIASLLLSIFPFVFGGRILTMIFFEETAESTKLYFADLVGAALGALTAPVLINLAGPVGYIIILSGVSLFLAVLHAGASRRVFAAGVTAFLGLALVLSQSVDFAKIFVPPNKTLGSYAYSKNGPSQWVYSNWDAFARMDVVGNDENSRSIFVDGGAGTRMYRFNGDLKSVEYLVSDLNYLPFAMRKGANTLVIGPGGGKEVLLALLGESTKITAVDVNPGMFEVVAKFPDFSGDIYNLPQVNAVVADGRSFLERNPQIYDIIFLPLVFTQAAEVQGYALAENYIFTQEAFETYYKRLTPGGILALRVHNEHELARSMATWLKVLHKEQNISPAKGLDYVAAFGTKMSSHAETDIAMPILLLKKEPLTEDELEFLSGVATNHPGADLAYLSGNPAKMRYLDLVRTEQLTLDQLIFSVDANIQPATDNWPFYYNSRHGLPNTLGFLLTILSVAGLVLSVYFTRESVLIGAGWRVPLYFALIGAGFMMVELPLLQRLTLLFGTPLQAMAITLFALLLAGGVGSFAGRYLPLPPLAIAWTATAGVGILAILYAVIMPALVNSLLVQDTVLRIGGGIGLTLPLGFFMGMPFPNGLKHFGKLYPDSTALAWAVNGFFSVAGSVATVALTMLLGQSWVLILGGMVYLFASVSLFSKKGEGVAE